MSAYFWPVRAAAIDLASATVASAPLFRQRAEGEKIQPITASIGSLRFNIAGRDTALLKPACAIADQMELILFPYTFDARIEFGEPRPNKWPTTASASPENCQRWAENCCQRNTTHRYTALWHRSTARPANQRPVNGPPPAQASCVHRLLSCAELRCRRNSSPIAGPCCQPAAIRSRAVCGA